MKGLVMIRVFLLDDHALVRAGYRMVLQNELDIDVIGEAASGEEGLPMIKKLKPDVVLCDLHLPGISGLEITERIVRAELGIKVLIVSVQEEGPMPKRLLDVGASAYIGKAGDSKELLKAIREAMRGKRFLGAEIAQRMALAGDAESPFAGLSPREMEISMMFCHGLRAEDIARKLSLSAKTVATHKCRLLAKLGVADTISMARLAAQHGITEPARSL
jgi:two-component system, NarL family, invasion response regulator UvrY